VRRSNTRPHVEPDVDRPFSTGGQLMCHEEMHHQMPYCRRLLVLQGSVWPNTLFCNWNFRTPAWVNNVIGLHESCLGQLPWDQFTGRVPFIEGFLSSGYRLGFSALLISLKFFPHTCNKSSKVVNDILVGFCFGNYIGKSLYMTMQDILESFAEFRRV
jgi:hypothetical protein